MSTVDDGAFDLDAALVLVRVDPRRGCAELHRLLAGEVAAYSRALGATEIEGQVDEVLDRVLDAAAGFAGHGRDIRIEALRTTTDVTNERLGDATGTELGAAVLQCVLGCSVAEAASITGRSPAVVEVNRPGPATTRYLRRRFPLDEPPPPGPAVAAHLGPRMHRGVPVASTAAAFSAAEPDRLPRRRRRVVAVGLTALGGLFLAGHLAGVGDATGGDDASVVTTGSDVILADIDPTPQPTPDAISGVGPDDDADRIEPPRDVAEPGPVTWSYDLGEPGEVVGTIDGNGVIEATMAPAPGWTVDVDEDTPPWIQATFTDGSRRIRFLAIADGPQVRVWVFDLDRRESDDELAAPPRTPAATPPAPTPRPTPRPPRESPPPRPEPAPPERGEDLADPPPTPEPASPPTPDSTPTPDKPDTTPTPDEPDEPDEPDTTPTPDEPDEPDTTPTPDEPDEPDTAPTPDEPDSPDGGGSGNSGPGGGSDRTD